MSLRQRVARGERLLGTVLTIPDPSLAELTSAAFDLVWIDLEHGALDVRDLLPLLPAVKSAGAAAVVRLPRADAERLPAILDAGVDGVVAPRIETAEQAEEFVARMRYPPEGTRGFGPRRAGEFGRTFNFWAAEEARPAALVQIESRAGVAVSDEIAAVDGVDALIIGTADLSFDLGEPQVLDSEDMRQTAETVRAAAAEARKAYGVAAASATAIAALLGSTGSIAMLSVDVRLYAAAIDAAAGELRGLLWTPQAQAR
jgi:2-keto-3-deoxy-L-rhamnonate aldolase RhmA